MGVAGPIFAASLTATIAIVSYWYISYSSCPHTHVVEPKTGTHHGSSHQDSSHHDEWARLEAVHAGLLRTEASVAVADGARIAVGFGGCLDVRGNALEVMKRLGLAPPKDPKNYNELNKWEEFADTFAYFFSHGASAGRPTDNDTLFDELMTSMTSLEDTQLSVGGNAPVMTRRLRREGVDVMLTARLSTALRLQIDPDVTVVGGEADKDDIHLILEYQRDAEWGPYTATRANRFIVHNRGSNSFLSMLKDFDKELAAYKPSLLVVSGLRLLFGEQHQKSSATGPPEAMIQLSSLLSSLDPSIRVHTEMSSFPDVIQLHDIVRHIIINQADSLGMNEQELPNIRRALRDLLVDDGGSCGAETGKPCTGKDHQGSGGPHDEEKEKIAVVSDSHPRISTTLDDMRAVFRLIDQHDARSLGLGHEQGLQRALSRLHVHTLAYQVIMTRRPLEEPETSSTTVRPRRLQWKNTRAAAAKASLTSNRHTCGRHNVDLENARLLVDESFRVSREGQGIDPEKRVVFNDNDPVACWSEDTVDVCIAPVLVCKRVVQTVGGGDNVSAGGLVLQL